MSLESEFHGRELLRAKPPTTIRDLREGRVPVHETNHETISYRLSGESSLFPFKQGEGNYLVVGPAVNGYDLLAMMHHAAPSKYYGIDFNDLKDWEDLYTEDNEKLLEAHRDHIPGWNEYENHRKNLLNHLRFDRPDAKDSSVTHVRPVVHLERTLQGRLKWNIGDLEPEIEHTIRRTIPDETLETHKLHPLLGPLLIAAYSPEVTKKWPHREQFREGHSNDMGTTQAIPLTVMRGADLLQSRLVSAMVEHCDVV